MILLETSGAGRIGSGSRGGVTPNKLGCLDFIVSVSWLSTPVTFPSLILHYAQVCGCACAASGASPVAANRLGQVVAGSREERAGESV